MGLASQKAWEIIQRKRKYFHKTLSEDAWNTNLDVMYNVFDHFSFWIDYTLSDTLLSSFIITLHYDIPIKDIVSWLLAWNIELPTPEEFRRGVLLKLERIDVARAFADWLRLPPEEEERIRDVLSKTEDTLKETFTPEVQKTVEETRQKKAYYDVSNYDVSYYDPPVVYEFLRSTLHAWFQKRGTYEKVKIDLEEFIKKFDIRREIAEDLFNRLSMFDAIKDNALTWDYGWWDRSYWGLEEKGSEVKPMMEFKDYQGVTRKVEYRSLIEPHACGYWDLGYWDLFFWDYTEPEKEKIYEYYREYLDSFLSMLRDALVVNAKSRIMATATALVNYQTREERRYAYRSSRLETYALRYSMRAQLEAITHRIVTRLKPNIDAYSLRLYKTAVLNLLSLYSAQHKWGLEAYRAMTDEEIKDVWLGRWTNQGLDKGILEELYKQTINIIKRYAIIRKEDRDRFMRYRLGW